MLDTIALSASRSDDRVPLAVLQQHLAAGRQARWAAEVALRGSLAWPDTPDIGYEVSARIAAMLVDVADRARQGRPSRSGGSVSDLAGELAGDGPLLRRLHAVAQEFVLGERLRARLSLDPVVPPLVLSWLAEGAEQAALATRVVQAQAAFVEGQRRMQLAAAEFPGDLLASALRKNDPASSVHSVLPQAGQGGVEARSSLLQELAARTSGTPDLLDMGIALFLSAVASASETERDEVALATGPGQHARFALLLVVAGFPRGTIERDVFLIHGHAERIGALAELDISTAAALLREAA